MKASRISLMILSLAAAPAFAGDVDLSLTNDSVKGQVNFFGTNNALQLGTGYTYREGGRDIFNVDFHAQGRTAIGNLPTTAGIGMIESAPRVYRSMSLHHPFVSRTNRRRAFAGSSSGIAWNRKSTSSPGPMIASAPSSRSSNGVHLPIDVYHPSGCRVSQMGDRSA